MLLQSYHLNDIVPRSVHTKALHEAERALRQLVADSDTEGCQLLWEIWDELDYPGIGIISLATVRVQSYPGHALVLRWHCP